MTKQHTEAKSAFKNPTTHNIDMMPITSTINNNNGTTTSTNTINNNNNNTTATTRPRELLPSPTPHPSPQTSQRSIPGFVSKLYRMVGEGGGTLIRWSDSGTSFTVIRPEEFSRTILPKYFKHNNFSSFVRQLNMYGFHKVPQVTPAGFEEPSTWEFTNPNFLRGRPDLLLQVKRKTGGKDEDFNPTPITTNNTAGNVIDLKQVGGLQSVLQELSALRMQQSAIKSDLTSIQRDSQLLWSETIASRERHQQQQTIIDKILRFLASVFSSDKSLTASLTPRKRPLMIEELSSSNPSTPIPLTSTHPNFADIDPIDGLDLFKQAPPNQDRIFDAIKTADEMQGDLDFLVDNLGYSLLDGSNRIATSRGTTTGTINDNNNNKTTATASESSKRANNNIIPPTNILDKKDNGDNFNLDWDAYTYNFYPSSQSDKDKLT